MTLSLQPTKFADAWVLSYQPFQDERGFFTRTFCADSLAANGLESTFVQHSMSYSSAKGTLRGLHFQTAPHEEVKIVRCLNGAIYDVIVDLRPQSPTYKQWQAFELTRQNRLQLYVPKGFAHGFQSLTPDVEVSYLISTPYVPAAASGVRFDDHAFRIEWPLAVSSISAKDTAWPDLK